MINTITFDITEKCNLDCSYCYHNKDIGITASARTLGRFKRLLKSLRPRRVVFMGGEPLLAFDKIKYVVQGSVGIQFLIITNLVMLTSKIAQWLKLHNVEIQCSIDGPLDVQDSQRPIKGGGSSFVRIEHNYKLAHWVSPNGYARATLMKEHIHRYYECVKYLLFDAKFAGCVVSVIGEPLDYLEFKNNLTKSVRLAGNRLVIYKPSTKYYCAAGIRKISVGVDGRVYPCHRFSGSKSLCLGDIFKGFKLDCLSIHNSSVGDTRGCPFIKYKNNGKLPKWYCHVKKLEESINGKAV